jgi:peptidoglycan hydrolase-like protein with peptidoglycan-binding domain
VINNSSSNSGGGSYGSPITPTTNPVIPATNGASPPASAFGQQTQVITANLGKGNRGTNVTILQQFLISQNKGPAAAALAKAGATSYFGVLTRAALAEFQGSVGISPALGNLGSITRAYLNVNYNNINQTK